MNGSRVFTLAVVVFLLGGAFASADTIQSNGFGGGPFNIGSTWDGGVVPGPNDHVVIVSPDTVTSNDEPEFANITVNEGATLRMWKVTLSDGGTLDVEGTFSAVGLYMGNGEIVGTPEDFAITTALSGWGALIVSGAATLVPGITVPEVQVVGSGEIVGASPVYEPIPFTAGGDLIYDGTAGAVRGLEWLPGSLPGVGVPAAVTLYGAEVDLGSADINSLGPLSLGSLLGQPGSSLTSTSGTLTLTDSFTIHGGSMFAANGGTVAFAAPGTQSLTANAPIAFNNLSVGPSTTLLESTPIPPVDYASVGGVLNNSGVIRRQITFSTGEVSFGLTGVVVSVEEIGSLTNLRIDRVDSSHPLATTSGATGRYWEITPDDQTGSTLTLTLPHDDLADPMICHSLGVGAWECDRTSFSNSSVTLSGITSIGGSWIVSDGPELGRGVTPVPATVEFGTVGLRESDPEKTVVLTNTSSEERTFTAYGIAIMGTDASEFQFVTPPDSSPLAVGASRELTVRFSPTTVGEKAAFIAISTDDPVTPNVTVGLTATAIDPWIAVSPLEINFLPEVASGGLSENESFIITSQGSGDLTITDITVVGDSSNFHLSGTAPMTIPTGQQWMINVMFEPESPGYKAATVEITSDDPHTSLIEVSLMGVGLGADMIAAPASLEFGPLPVNMVPTVSLHVFIANTGTEDVEFTGSGISLQGANSGEFFAEIPAITALAPGEHVVIPIVFDPVSLGQKVASLQIETADGTTSIPLAGEGTEFVGPTGLTSSEVARGLVGSLSPAPTPGALDVNDDTQSDAADVVTNVQFIDALD